MNNVKNLVNKRPVEGLTSSLKHLSSKDNWPKRVVTLGKNGFIASYLVRCLEKQAIPFEAVAKERVDLTSSSAVKKLHEIIQETDTVVVLPVLSPDKGRNFRTFMKNLLMAENLCEFFERKSCAHVIYLSSDAVYDAGNIPMDEESSREPLSLYALTHTVREMMLESVLKTKNIPFCILRPVNIYGLGETHNSYGPNRFIAESCNEHKITIFGNGEERRCFLYIEDAVRLISMCIENKSAGTLNLTSPWTITFMDLAKMILELCPFKVELKYEPREIPIVHRTYVNAHLFSAFPNFRFTPIKKAIQGYIHLYIASLLENQKIDPQGERWGMSPRNRGLH